jgi:hypothetical protein
MSLQLGCSGKSSHATNNVNNGTNNIQVDAALEAKGNSADDRISLHLDGDIDVSVSLSRSSTGEQIRLYIDKYPLKSTDDQIGSRISPSVTATNDPTSHSCSLSTTNITDGNMEVWSEYCAHWYSAS